MKIALLSPYSEISSLGVRTLSAYLKSKGISTRLVFLPLQRGFFSISDFSLYSDQAIENLGDLVKDDDLIGISLMSNYFDSVADLTRKLKKRFPQKSIVWGGIHPTVMPEQSIEIADHICLGEGEISFVELCQSFANGKSHKNIAGIWSRVNGHIEKGQAGPVMMDLNQIPPQDYDLENNFILRANKDFIPITKNNLQKFLGVTYWTMYTRGCPFSCTYCCNDAFRKVNKSLTSVRAKSPENMIEELLAIKSKFPFIKYMYFVDDTLFALSEEKIKEFAESYKKHINLPFIVPGLHPALFTDKKFDHLVKSGLIRVRMGIQSGSQRITDQVYRRKQDNKTIISIAHSLQKYARKMVMPNYDLILDNPWESRKDKLESIDLVSKLEPPYSLTLLTLTFFPGTSLYTKAIEENIISEKAEIKRMLDYEPTYLNLILALFGLFTMPKWLFKILMSKRLINTKRRFPILHRIIFYLTIYRRGLCSLLKRDFSVFPPALQSIFCLVLPYHMETTGE